MQAAIYAPEGLELNADERAFFRDADPAGFILFRRNCDNPGQVLRLTDSLRDLSGRSDLPILVDQEGGRVVRMRPPAWPAFPPAERFADLYQAAPSSAIEAVRSNARALALTLRACGINVNCLPLLDVRQEGATDIIEEQSNWLHIREPMMRSLWEEGGLSPEEFEKSFQGKGSSPGGGEKAGNRDDFE